MSKGNQRRRRCKRVQKGRAEARNDVQIAAAGFDEAEQAGAVHPLAARQNLVQIGLVLDDEIESFQSAVTSRVHEIDVADVLAADKADDVGLGKFSRCLFQYFGQFVAAHRPCIGTHCGFAPVNDRLPLTK